jgi:hypothetical protein
MIKLIIKLSLLVLISTYCISCSNVKITVDAEKLKSVKSIAIYEVKIVSDVLSSKPYIPEVGKDGAKEFLEDTLAIKKTEFENYLGELIDEYSNANILFSEKLRGTKEYLAIQDSVDTFELFLFGFKINNDDKKMFARIAQALDVDCLVFALTKVCNPSMNSPEKYNHTHMIFVDREGNVFLDCTNETRSIKSSSFIFRNFIITLNRFYRLSDEIIRKVSGVTGSEKSKTYKKQLELMNSLGETNKSLKDKRRGRK